MEGRNEHYGSNLEPSGEREVVLLIGHNPALHDLARSLPTPTRTRRSETGEFSVQ